MAIEVTKDGRAFSLGFSRVDEIRAAYADAERITLAEPTLRVQFAQSEIAQTPTKTREQE